MNLTAPPPQVQTNEPCVDCKQPIGPGWLYLVNGPRHVGPCPEPKR